MKNFMICWVGETDLNASIGIKKAGIGPIGQAVESGGYDLLCLLSDWDLERTELYIKWLQTITSTEIISYPIKLSAPTVFEEIYEAAVKTIEDINKKYKEDFHYTFHISPGTPQMAVVWILLSKTRFPASIIESSKKYGVKKTSIPFDISIDFIPNLLSKADENLERLAFAHANESSEFDSIVHRSEIMQRTITNAKYIARPSIPVLLEGESGTGKELFARAIHKYSERKNKPFRAINCGAIPENLIESVLFGHEKGAFTGADRPKKGYFEAANTGTIFLDEIGELPKEMQVKMLRVLQEGEITRVGSTHAQKVDVRIISATNKWLIKEVAKGAFREDLFYRLAVGVIKLPPLRERSGDINVLIDHFLKEINQNGVNGSSFPHKEISASARNVMLNHYWPGNIRELNYTLIRAVVYSRGAIITKDDIQNALLLSIQGKRDRILDRSLDEDFDIRETIKKVAVHYLKRGLDEANHNKTKAAQLLGLNNYQTLTNWLKRYNLE